MGAEKLEEFKKCPQCAEEVRSEALVCKHCKNDLVEMETKSVRTVFLSGTIIKQHENDGWTYTGDSVNMIAGTSLGKVLNFKRPKRPGFFAKLFGEK